MAINCIVDYFGFSKNKTNLKIETLAGITTFITMSYVIFLQPAILGATGMDKGSCYGGYLYSQRLGDYIDGSINKLSHSSLTVNGA